MYKKSTDTLKKSTKPVMVISTIVTLLLAANSITPIMNSSAFDFGLISKDNNTGSIETNSLFNCVGAAKTCINENENENNEIANNGEGIPPPPIETAQLLVTKNVECVSVGGDPGNEAVCAYIINGVDPSEFTITVTGNNPNPATFTGSTPGTQVILEPGAYTISETVSPQLENLFILLNAADTSEFILTASGDCTLIGGQITGTINADEQQTCILTNTVHIFDATVPL